MSRVEIPGLLSMSNLVTRWCPDQVQFSNVKLWAILVFQTDSGVINHIIDEAGFTV